MEGGTSGDPNLLIIELMNCQDNARQLEHHLQSHLHQPCPTFPGCKSMVQSILNSMDKSISMAKSVGVVERRQRLIDTSVARTEDSPRSGSGTPVSRSPAPAFRDQERRELTKRSRKALPKRTRQMQVSPGMGSEGPVEDEYSWRKYGQKVILGATYPRAYYRCTHQKTHGCLATKHVQRSDKDPNVFDVTYRGEHTCQQKQGGTLVSAMAMGGEHCHIADGLFQSTGVGVDAGVEETINFSSMTTEAPGASHTHIFSLDGSHAFHAGNSGGSFSSFISSPTTSESNYFQVSTLQGSRHEGPSSSIVDDVELTEMMWPTTSTSTCPAVDMDFNHSSPAPPFL